MYSAELMRELGTVVKVDVEVIMHKWEHTGDDDWQFTTEENLAALFLLFLLFSSLVVVGCLVVFGADADNDVRE